MALRTQVSLSDEIDIVRIARLVGGIGDTIIEERDTRVRCQSYWVVLHRDFCRDFLDRRVG